MRVASRPTDRLETMSLSKSGPASSPLVVGAAVADVVLILVFAAIGRDAHARDGIFTGVFLTAWPFLAGAAAGWLATRAWRDPMSLRRAGAGVWLGSLIGGMLLRALTGQTVVVAFVVVALLSLGVLLMGYRALYRIIRRRRS